MFDCSPFCLPLSSVQIFFLGGVLNHSPSISAFSSLGYVRQEIIHSTLRILMNKHSDGMPSPVTHETLLSYYLCVGIWMRGMPFSPCFIHKHVSKCQSKVPEIWLLLRWKRWSLTAFWMFGHAPLWYIYIFL